LVELKTARILRELGRTLRKAMGTVIFSLERSLSGGTKLTRDYAHKLGKPVLHIYETRKERIPNPDSLRLEIQALADFLRSKKIAVLNVAGPREIEGARCLRVDADYVALVS
jgi:hypothetical protein